MLHIKDFDFNTFHTNQTYKLKKKKYTTSSFSFDIETTSTVDENGKKIAFPYIYQFGINGKAFYCRYMSECVAFFNAINEFLEDNDINIVCLVHNLSYEFTFMSAFLDFTNVFARKKGKPMKATYNNIDFRCSMTLSNMSLDTLANRFCSIKKLKGDLDYTKIRYPETKLTEKEMMYCENDVLILNEYWSTYIVPTFLLKKGGAILPLTNTSIVRQSCKNRIEFFYNYNEKLSAIAPSTELYSILTKAFIGGYTHANIYKSMRVLDNVGSYDFTSSYPAQMLHNKYPMSPFKEVKSEFFQHFIGKTDEYALLVLVIFKNLQAKSQHTYLSVHKSIKIGNHVADNGRILSCDLCTYWLTEKDLEIVKMFYSGSIAIEKMYVSKKGYLPKFIIDSVVDFYKLKNDYKKQVKEYEKTNHPDKELIGRYLMNSKNMLNSLFGMMCTRTDGDEIVWDGKEWDTELSDYEFRKGDFLVFQWGVWVTANARSALMQGVHDIGNDVCYCDTDSIKLLNPEKYTDYFHSKNLEIREKVKKACEYFNLDYNSVEKIGEWDFEGVYKQFKTLGAKKYCTDNSVTVSGISKQAFMNECERRGCSTFDLLKNGTVIEPQYTHKTTMLSFWKNEITEYKYIIDDVEHTIPIGNYVHASEAPFSISITPNYKKLFNDLLTNKYNTVV